MPGQNFSREKGWDELKLNRDLERLPVLKITTSLQENNYGQNLVRFLTVHRLRDLGSS